MARKMPDSLQKWLTPRLRRLSLYWPGKTIARDMAKVKVKDGEYKNGNPIYKTMYKCALCEKSKKACLYEKEFTHMDHRSPVVNVEKGFEDWDKYVTGLFASPEAYDCLCIPHHKQKTELENIERKRIKREQNLHSSKGYTRGPAPSKKQTKSGNKRAKKNKRIS